jgi:archaellin
MELPARLRELMKMIKRVKKDHLITTGCIRMSASTLCIKTFCVSLALVLLVIISGCTTAPSGSNGTIPVTSLPLTTVSQSPVPSPTSNPVPSGADIQLRSNVYGLSSNPQAGLDTIYFSIGLPSQVPAVNLTSMVVVFTATGTAPVILTRSSKDSTSTFTTTQGNNLVTSLGSGDEVEITFRVKGVPAGSKVQIEVKPSSGAVLPISGTVPAMISSLNILD